MIFDIEVCLTQSKSGMHDSRSILAIIHFSQPQDMGLSLVDFYLMWEQQLSLVISVNRRQRNDKQKPSFLGMAMGRVSLCLNLPRGPNPRNLNPSRLINGFVFNPQTCPIEPCQPMPNLNAKINLHKPRLETQKKKKKKKPKIMFIHLDQKPKNKSPRSCSSRPEQPPKPQDHYSSIGFKITAHQLYPKP